MNQANSLGTKPAFHRLTNKGHDQSTASERIDRQAALQTRVGEPTQPQARG